jgi:DNA-binding NarL/FixJ family response regulator
MDDGRVRVVLLVDDLPPMRRGVRALLERGDACAVVAEATSSAEALALAAARGADVVLAAKQLSAAELRARAAADAPGASPLTAREAEVLGAVAEGLTNRQIARALAMSDQTVKNHLATILRKTDTANRTHAAFVALRCGWIAPPAALAGAPAAEHEAPGAW